MIFVIGKGLCFGKIVFFIFIIEVGCRVVFGIECERVGKLRNYLLLLLLRLLCRMFVGYSVRYGYVYLGLGMNVGSVGFFVLWKLVDGKCVVFIRYGFGIFEDIG